MPKYISEQVRQRVIEIAEQHGFAVQLKDAGDDQYVKVLMFYSKPLNQSVYVRKDRAVGAGGIPAYFQVAVHPAFFNKSWVSAAEDIQEYINSQKKKNLHSSSNYQEFPVYPENVEPCGMCFKAANYDALAKLFQRMAGSKSYKTLPIAESVADLNNQTETTSALSKDTVKMKESSIAIRPSVNINKVPTKGLIIKSPAIEKILAGIKTWEMRSGATQVRGPIALIKKGSGQIVGIANLVGVKGPLSKQEKLDTVDKHQISLDRLESHETDKWNTAWVLENAQPLITQVNYQHPNGAVTWVNLDRQIQENLTIAMQ